MTAEQRIYDYLIQNGNTTAENAMLLSALGAWTRRENINTGIKLSTFIITFPRMFALSDRNRRIYALTPDILQAQDEDSLLEFQPNIMIGVPEVDVDTVLQPHPALDTYTDAMKAMKLESQRIGGKSKSKSRSAKKSKSKSRRKSRSRKNRNRRNKTARY